MIGLEEDRYQPESPGPGYPHCPLGCARTPIVGGGSPRILTAALGWLPRATPSVSTVPSLPSFSGEGGTTISAEGPSVQDEALGEYEIHPACL